MKPIFITPHNTTSNIYDQHKIVKDNIQKINNYLNSAIYHVISYSDRTILIETKETQKNILKSINRKIREHEQQAFPFGF